MKLPQTWVEASVEMLVLDLQPGFAQKPGEEDEGTTPQIRTHNVSPDGKITLKGIKHVSASAKELDRYFLVKGDVVFNNTNSEEWVGKTALFDQEGEYVFSNHMTRLRANPDLISPEYLANYLQLLWSMGYSKTRAKRWVSQAGIEGAALASFKTPLPTLPEQERIVSLLRQVEKVDALRSNANDLLQQLAKLRFAEMFGHPAENPKGFESALLNSFGTLDRGISKNRPRDASHLFGGTYPFIQTGDVSNAGDWITSYKSTYSEAGLAQSKLWPKGTLCITIAANIAKAAILEFDACFPDSVVGFMPHAGVSSEYVLYCLRFYEEYFEHRAPKSAQMNINLDTLRTLRIPKPPKVLQEKFANFVREIRSLGNIASRQTDRHKVLGNDLKVLAFTGELTANWRENRQEELSQLAIVRDSVLHERGAKFASRPSEPVLLPPTTDAQRPARQWIMGELSDFQRLVFMAFCNYGKQPLLAEDAEVFARFCDDEDVIECLKDFGTSLNNRIRRTLSQLAALGLIGKITLSTQNVQTGERDYLKAFRPLRESEDTKMSDVEMLRRLLSSTSADIAHRFTVERNFEVSSHVGVGGMFQVIALTDDEDKDRTELVDQGKHYATLEELAGDIAVGLGVPVDQVMLEE